MRRRFSLLFLVLSLSFAACGGAGDDPAQGTSAPGAAPAGGADPAVLDSPSGAGSIHLVVTGGPHAGTYDVPNVDGCSFGLAQPGAWGNQFTRDTQDPREFSSLQMIVPNAKAAAGGTNQFNMTVSFGPMFSEGQTDYAIETREGAPRQAGQGTASVEDGGDTGKVSFDATTSDGVRLQGTITCSKVTRAG